MIDVLIMYLVAGAAMLGLAVERLNRKVRLEDNFAALLVLVGMFSGLGALYGTILLLMP